MSISSRITQMEQHIGNAYDKIEDLGIDLTDVDKNINNISSMLENVWNEYPKVTATDVEEASINETKKGRMEIDLKGNTSQEQLTGKNLFNKNITPYNNAGGNVTILNTGVRLTSTISSSSTYGFQLYKILDLSNYIGSTIRIKMDFTASNNIIKPIFRIGFCDENGQNRSSMASSDVSGTTISFNVSSISGSSKYLAVWLYITEQTALAVGDYIDYTNIILTIDNADMTYEPYCGGIPSPNPDFPQPIKNVTGNANVKIQNKNLFDGTYSEEGKFLYANGETGSQSNFNISNFVEVKPNTYYTLSSSATSLGGSASICQYDDEGNYIIGIQYNGVSQKTIMTENNCAKVKFSYKNDVSNYQLEQGSTATSYVPHQEQNYPFTFSEGQRGMQGTTLEDDGIHNKWYEESLINRKWSKYTNTDSQGNTFGFFMNLSKIPKRDTTATNFAKCNILMQKQRTKVSTSDEEGFYLGDGTDTLFIKIRQSLIPNGTIEELQTLLTNTNAKIQFEVPEEEIIPYSSTQQAQYNAIKQAKSYDDITYITSESDELGFIMDVESLSNGASSSNTRTLALGSLDKGSLEKGSLNNIKEVDTEDTEDETSVESEE